MEKLATDNTLKVNS